MRRSAGAALALAPAALLVLGATKPTPEKPFDLGKHHRAVSTKSAAAQKAFDEGLVWAFSFNHGEAERAFRRAAAADPELAMAWWGVSLVNGPHINNPIVDEAHAKTAWEALGEAKRRLAGASEVERSLVDALGSRYAMPQPADRAPLEAAYAAAMGKVAARFPKDADVATLHAEALMDTRPWDQWTPAGEPQPGTSEVLAALERARALAPNHPGALHLTIHALEASPRPERAKDAADRLRNLVPDAGHMVHMPSHIDVRLGRWADAAAANERAMAADATYAARREDLGFWAIYMSHNAHFLAYTGMMEGRSALAFAKTKDVVGMFPEAVVKEQAAFLDAFQTVHLEALKRFGRWDEILKAPEPPAHLPVARAFRVFARGVAQAALGNPAEAEKENAAFLEALALVPKEGYFWGSNAAADVLGVAVPYLAGEIAFRRGETDVAVAKLREAVRLEGALKYDEPPAWTTPARHALGAILLASRKAADAEAVYREDLKVYPENGWALKGLADALEAQGKKAEAAAARGRFEKAWARADVKAESSCLCVKAAGRWERAAETRAARR